MKTRRSLAMSSLPGAVLRWVGGALLVLAAIVACYSWQSTRGLIRTQATVTENVAVFARGGGIVYRPRLRFRTAAGETVLVLSGRATDDIAFEAGKVVPVMYPAGDPDAVLIATKRRVYGAAIWLAVIGTVLFDIGLVLRRIRILKAHPRLANPSLVDPDLANPGLTDSGIADPHAADAGL